MVLPWVYTHPMAKVMISIPDVLLGMLDQEAERRRTTRSALLQNAARREHSAWLAAIESRSGPTSVSPGRDWDGPFDAGAMIRADRHRDD